MNKRIVTRERLREVFSYDEDTGLFTRIAKSGYKGLIGAVVGSLTERGYIVCGIDSRKYFAHRLAFLYVDGYFPEHGIDHINKIKTDNRRSNLREVSQQCNIRNTGNISNNVSSVKGVSWSKNRSKWEVRLKLSGKHLFLGYFDSFSDAVMRRYEEEKSLCWESCDSCSPAHKYLLDNKLL